MPARKKKSMKKSSSMPARKSVHPLHKPYFIEEQEQFFKDHPLAQSLLTVFLVCVVIFMVVAFMNRPLMMGY